MLSTHSRPGLRPLATAASSGGASGANLDWLVHCRRQAPPRRLQPLRPGQRVARVTSHRAPAIPPTLGLQACGWRAGRLVSMTASERKPRGVRNPWKELGKQRAEGSYLTFKHHNAARVKLCISFCRVLLSAGGRSVQASTRTTLGGWYGLPCSGSAGKRRASVSLGRSRNWSIIET